jgi:multiple sugar transport system permease protein
MAGARATARGAWTLLTPFGVGVTVLLLVPTAITFALAFTAYTGLSAPSFNGLDNLGRALSDPLAAAALRASLIFALIAVPLRMLLATGLGLALAAPRRGSRLARVLVYLPTVIPDVALALVFLWVFNPLFGPVNAVLHSLGLPEPLWLGTPWGARWAIVVMMLLPIGEAFLVVLAARRALSPDVYEAAAVDGASPRQQLLHVTLPQLAPLLVLLAVRDTILSLQVNFVPAYALTDGGPDASTLFLPVYIYDQAFEFLGVGYGATLTLILLAVTVVLLGLQAWLARRWGWLPR